ncbi:MAG: hypothetical protein IKH24_03510 [Bacteroidales bacterium]|nr:hypothetical protein [Bacteroidales bacterium]MBR3449890.1 hypothetical protein [Bacteroidales bacterium]
MKKLFATLFVMAAVMMVVPNTAKAIEDPFRNGTLLLGAQAGIYPGIGGTLYGDYVVVDSWWKGHFTVGAQAGFRYWNYGGEYHYIYNDLAITPRATYGLRITNIFEVHAGVVAGLGVRFYDAHSQLGFCYGPIAGIRLFLSESVAFSAEFNYSNFGTWANAGLAFKF